MQATSPTPLQTKGTRSSPAYLLQRNRKMSAPSSEVETRFIAAEEPQEEERAEEGGGESKPLIISDDDEGGGQNGGDNFTKRRQRSRLVSMVICILYLQAVVGKEVRW